MKRANPLTELDDSETRSALPHYSRGPWEIVRCRATGMVYLANPPDYARLADEFEWEKSYLQEKAERAAREPALALVSGAVKRLRRRLQRRERIVRLCAGLLRELHTGAPLRVLDVGCASADKLLQIAGIAASAQIALRPMGVEISPVLAKQAHARLEPLGGGCIQNAATEGVASLENRSVDLIILCTFLEHEINPLPLLRACAAKLAEHGRMVIKVPNFDSLNRIVRQGRWCGFRYPDHVNYFTPQTLRLMVEKSGLRVRRMGLFDRFPTSDNMYAICAHPDVTAQPKASLAQPLGSGLSQAVCNHGGTRIKSIRL